MQRKEIILLGMAGGHRFSPVQVQKLFFLIDKNIGARVGGPFFSFTPYDYGPFDKAVYAELEKLKNEDLVEIVNGAQPSMRYYQLSKEGEIFAEEIRSKNPVDISSYVETLSRFVRSLSFKDLVSAVYKAYPDMKANSVFTE